MAQPTGAHGMQIFLQSSICFAKFESEVRIPVLDNVMGEENKWECFREIATRTSLPKRWAIPW